ncbi:hypothetical protein NVV76_09630 [Pediococcus ethanolidurans]|uniref:hypothetical protein n=1 Tax=Pediococcus ethanolidurans TaxID=319653 RepID=UPI001C1EB386|nr:hypothetical protein [Pediococcus ethanolidurans]MBU7555666.1 hypothetical protein [Pediococcus ethanolidurans]MCT4398589.1 hypothetical protein [Pediococcus ethanolidurans]MCV3324493.1 hypothetical protein [Pediococcus ethanolidurans]MCV3328410.1 hypothetical protein [Pediococcus ethanolidurans]MCV3555940.1 hypothetical protein [Pediococcus ethanolidurans]
MRIRKGIFSIIFALLGVYMFITGAASTLSDEPARMAMLTGVYWMFLAVILWLLNLSKSTLFNDIALLGVTIIIMQFLVFGFDIMLIFQIILLLIILMCRFFKWI